jgi:hypothetical protein
LKGSDRCRLRVGDYRVIPLFPHRLSGEGHGIDGPGFGDRPSARHLFQVALP